MHTRIITFALLILALFAILASQSKGDSWVAPVEGLYPSPEAQCGARCFATALQLFGKRVPYTTVLEDVGTDVRGTTIAGLLQGARKEGLYALAVKIKRETLCDALQESNQKLVAICHQDPAHFVLWYRNEHGSFSLVDPRHPNPNNNADPSDLGDFSGAAVLISDAPIQIEIWTDAEVLWSRIGLATIFVVLFAFGSLIGHRINRFPLSVWQGKSPANL